MVSVPVDGVQAPGRVTAALVIGGGLAGAAFAIRVARAGRRVVLIERESGENDKVCGEFLSGETQAAIGALGVDLSALGALPIQTVSLCRGADRVTVKLPFPASSLSRRRLDERLLQEAVDAGAEVHRGAAVTAVAGSVGDWRAELADGRILHAEALFLATGKHDIPGRPRGGGTQDDLVAFKGYWRLSPAQTSALGDGVELHLFDGGYAGLQRVEGGRANLCFLVSRAVLKEVGRPWPVLLAHLRRACPQVDLRLVGGQPIHARPMALAALPYGYVRTTTEGPWHLGDQAAVIPSFSGDGMALALHSAAVAAEAYLAGRSSPAFQKQLAADVGAQVRRATWLSRALVRPGTQALIMTLACRFPALVEAVARSTRLSPRAQARVAGLHAPSSA